MGGKPRKQPVKVCREGILYRGAVRAVHHLNPEYKLDGGWEDNRGVPRGGCGTSYRYFESQEWGKVTCKVCLRSREAQKVEELDLPPGIIRSDYRGSYMYQARNGLLQPPKKTVLWKESDGQG